MANPFLARAMRIVRTARPPLRADQPFFTRVERVPAGNYVEIWFRTGGCSWDHAGGCTMCNYGYGSEVSAAGAVEAVRAALGDLSDVPNELMVSPSGGMWDGREVPTEALRPIYELAAAAKPARFLIETRVETITGPRMCELREALPGTELAVEVGLESSHDGVLTYCVNKGSTAGMFEEAAAKLRSHDIHVYANVCLGTAFLGRITAVRDAVASVRWALAHGADTVVLFPLHVKPFTLLHALQSQGAYSPVSLWDLVEALHVLGPELSPQIEIAWYKSYYDTAEKVTTSPVGCSTCTPHLVARLDRYRATQAFEIVAELEKARCGCAPERAFASEPRLSDEEVAARVLEGYEVVASALGADSLWWGLKPRLELAVRLAFEGYEVSLGRA